MLYRCLTNIFLTPPQSELALRVTSQNAFSDENNSMKPQMERPSYVKPTIIYIHI